MKAGRPHLCFFAPCQIVYLLILRMAFVFMFPISAFATQYFLGVHAGGSDMVCLAAFTARAQRAASLITSLLINVCDCLNVAVGVALPGRLSLRLARRGGA